MDLGDPRSAAQAAAERIVVRRATYHDPDQAMISDDPRQVIWYVLTYQRVPSECLADDIADALAIIAELRGRFDSQELALLRLGRRLRISFARLAGALGLRSRQAAEQRLLRLQAGADGLPRDDHAARQNGRLAPRPGRTWMRDHAAEVLAAARAIAALASAMPNADMELSAECMEGLDGDSDATLKEALVWLGLISGEHAGLGLHKHTAGCAAIEAAAPLLAGAPPHRPEISPGG